MPKNTLLDLHHKHSTQSLAPLVGQVLLHFLEMQIPMGIGALVCYLLGRLILASSNISIIYHPGTYLYTAGDILFLSLPVVAWMVFRGHGWRHSIEMVVAMIIPVVAIIVWGQRAGPAYRLWLVTAMYPAMCLGMLVYMAVYRENFTKRKSQSAHVANSEGAA